MADTATCDAFSVDSFHRDAFRLVQPMGRGHRSGIDAMILAAAVPTRFSGRLADLGAGAGAAGFAVAARCECANVTLVEQAPAMLDCAQRSLDLPHNDRLSPRLNLLPANVALAGKDRSEAGLEDCAFDFVIMNPPFNSARDRATPDTLKRMAHVMDDDLFERWVRTAAAITRPGGHLALIARPVSLAPILAALEGRFGSALLMPVYPNVQGAAIRIVLRAQKGNRGGLCLAPPLILHEGTRHYSARADTIANGKATLFDD